MATVKNSDGKSLSQLLHVANKKAAWIKKVHSNTKCLQRIGHLVQLAKGWDRPPTKDQPNKLRLQYIGLGTTPNEAEADISRIQNILEVTLNDKMQATARMGRIQVEITLVVPWSQLQKAA